MPDSKPNILVIWGDDIGITNLSCYSDGLMGCRAAGRATRRLIACLCLAAAPFVHTAKWRRTRSLLGEDLAQLGLLLGRQVAGDQLGIGVLEGVLHPIHHRIGAQHEQR